MSIETGIKIWYAETIKQIAFDYKISITEAEKILIKAILNGEENA